MNLHRHRLTVVTQRHAGSKSLPSWTRILTTGDTPTPRFGHVASVSGSCMLIFGGFSGEHYLNDCWSLNLSESMGPCLAFLFVQKFFLFEKEKEGEIRH